MPAHFHFATPEGRTYCGRNSRDVTPNLLRATCPDCQAAVRADEAAR